MQYYSILVTSCHIKAQWSNHSRDSCFNWPTDVCYSADREQDRRQGSFQVNTVSPRPLAKLEGEWYLDHIRGQRGTSVVAHGFLGITFHPEVSLHLSFQSTFCSPCPPLYIWVHLQRDSALQARWQLYPPPPKTLDIQWQRKHDPKLIIQHL